MKLYKYSVFIFYIIFHSDLSCSSEQRHGIYVKPRRGVACFAEVYFLDAILSYSGVLSVTVLIKNTRIGLIRGTSVSRVIKRMGNGWLHSCETWYLFPLEWNLFRLQSVYTPLFIFYRFLEFRVLVNFTFENVGNGVVWVGNTFNTQ